MGEAERETISGRNTREKEKEESNKGDFDSDGDVKEGKKTHNDDTEWAVGKVCDLNQEQYAMMVVLGGW
ncbi:hypothetical protein SESBI_37787 [Sesbania bispinosa]|nr:hypothetical protein SESBI_37787 [Sesbania bispinosa]